MPQTPTFLDDPQFDLANHDEPFSPLEDAPELVAHLAVDGWDCSGILHEAEAETEKYELDGDEWEYTGTDTETVDHHAITWLGDHAVPGIDGSEQAKVGIEYAEDAIHIDENGDPVEMAPGYILFGHAGTADGDYLGDISGGTYTNLARAVCDAVQMLTFIRDGMLPADTTTAQPVRDLIEDLTGTPLPE